MRPEILDKKFSLERVGLLMRNRAMEDLGAFLIVAGVCAANNILSLIFSDTAAFNHPFSSHGETIWCMIIVLGGLLYAGRAFRAMHDGRGGADWILLPATPLEKYVAAFASYVLFYPVLASLAAFGLSAAFEGVARALHGASGVIFNPLIGLSLSGVAGYATLASLALAASARFSKIPLVKAAALASAWGVVLGLFFLGGLLVFTPEGREVLARHHRDFQFASNPEEEPLLTWLFRAFAAATGVFAVTYGYFRVAEKEAADEVQ